jgi:hypothetical protein
MSKPVSSLALWLFCAGLVLAPHRVHATSAHHRSIRQLVHQSDVTVLGRTIGQESFWQGPRIMTKVRVAVDEVWTGRAPREPVIDVITLGGVVGGIGQRVDGAAALPDGGQVVLHLRQHDGEYLPVAMAQGVWHVSALSPSSSLVRRAPADRLVMPLSGAPEPPPTTLEALRFAIEEADRAR